MARQLSPAMQQWIDEQLALLPPMTEDDFARAAEIFAAAPRRRVDAA